MPKRPRRGHKEKPKGKDAAPLSRKQKSRLKMARQADEELQGPVIYNPSPPRVERSRGDSGKLLTDPNKVVSDLKLVEEAVNRGWNIRRKNMLRRRAEEIALKTTAQVVTKDGVFESEHAADQLSVNALKVLVAMDKSDVERVHKSKPEKPSTVINNSVTTNVLNATNGAFDERTIELARLAYKFGAREFSVNGRQVPIGEIIGTIDAVPDQENGVIDSVETTDNSASETN